jgi:hypothetical protein
MAENKVIKKYSWEGLDGRKEVSIISIIDRDEDGNKYTSWGFRTNFSGMDADEYRHKDHYLNYALDHGFGMEIPTLEQFKKYASDELVGGA